MVIPRPLAVLKDISDEDLEKELASRKAKRASPPMPLEKPDFSKLRDTVINGIALAFEQCYENEDFEHYVYEEALKAVYGPDFFAWRNAQNWK